MKHALNIFSAGGAKLTAFPEAVDAWRDGAAIAPITVEIHPTEQCGHRCPNCQAQFAISRPSVRSLRKVGAHLDFGALNTLWALPPKGVILSGNTGDPLMHPDIGELLAELRNRRVPTVLITNGEHLQGDVAEEALRACRGIRISIDAHDAESFARTHGRRDDAWLRLCETLRALMSKRATLGVQCDVGVGYLTNAATSTGMAPATMLARDLGVDYIQFRPYHHSFDDVSDAMRVCRTFETDRFKVLASDQKYSQIATPERRYARCHGAWFFSVIDARGDAYVCCHHVGRAEARLGSLYEQSWREIMVGDQRKQVLSSFPTSSCVPLCRLNAQNAALEQVRATGEVMTAHLPDQVAHHAVFL